MMHDIAGNEESISLSFETNHLDGSLSVSAEGAEKDTAISTFTISGTKTAFIAGYENLSWSDFKAGYAGDYFQSDLIIDAEKCSSITQDNMMCWAGTAANMLYYTGWILADTASEDDVASEFFSIKSYVCPLRDSKFLFTKSINILIS